MHSSILSLFVVIILSVLSTPTNAQIQPTPPTPKEALAIISTHERLKANLFKVIRITPGQLLEKNGFQHKHVIRVMAFAPVSGGRPKRTIRHYIMHYTAEYGWFLETIQQDARGIYLEISSQNKGRIFVR